MIPSPLVFGIGAILVWSTNAVVAKDALAQLSVSQVLTFQFAGASVVFAIARRLSQDKGPFSLSPQMMIIGLFGLVGTVVLQYLAFAAGPITAVNILTYAWPLLTALSIIATRKSSTPCQLAAVSATGFVGVALLIGGSGTSLSGDGLMWGYLFAIGSAALMAMYSIGVSRALTPPSDFLLPASLFGTAATALWWCIGGGEYVSPQSAMTALYLGLGPMGLGYVLWSYAIKTGPVGSLSTLGYATPVLSTSFLVLSGERMTTTALLASILIIAACTASGAMTRREASRAR